MKSTKENINIILDFKHASVEKWEALLDSSCYATPFQTPGFYKFIEDLKGIKPFMVILEQEDKYMALVIGMIQSEQGLSAYFSRRAVIYGGMVFKDDEVAAYLTIELAKQLYKILKNRAIYLEIRNYNNYEHIKNTLIQNGYSYIPYFNIQVDCKNMEKLQSRISSGKSRQIKKSLINGAYIHRADQEYQVRAFYEILKNLYVKKVKKPLPGWDFFKAFFYSGLGEYLLVIHEGKVIGGIMCPVDKHGVYEWYIAGLDGQNKLVYPSVLATWAAMEFANKNGIPKFDFMGAGQPEKDYGVRDFKLQFGGELVEHGRLKIIYNKILYGLGQLGIYFLSKIK